MKDAELPRGRCEACKQIFLSVNLARFGRHKGSPLLCHACATATFEEMKRKLSFHVINNGKSEVIEKK